MKRRLWIFRTLVLVLWGPWSDSRLKPGSLMDLFNLSNTEIIITTHNNNQVLVGRLSFAVKGFWALWGIYGVCVCYYKQPGSSVSIVSDYGLDDWAIRVQYPAGAKDFTSNLCVQTGSGAHPAACRLGTEGPLPVAKRGRRVRLTTHPSLVPRSRMSRN
jgi:hypothetical protein